MPATPSPSTQKVRDQIDHPVIDSDGHLLEFLPAIRERLRGLGGDGMARGFDAILNAQQNARHMSPEDRRSFGLFRLTWWGFPARNSLDRATAMLPKLQYERLPEQGIDYAVVYPTFGLTAPMVEDRDLRLALVRAFNEYYADSYADLGDRLCPVALIPMHTPEEAIAELEYAVETLKLKAVLLAGFVYRPLAGENVPRAARWVDTFGWESPYDYDPVWAKCVELGVNPTFHSSAMGWHRGNSQTNYVFNHIGNFAVAGETICRTLFMDGVPKRFPSLQFAFLEGGVGWGCNLYSDILSHFEKRNRESVHEYNPIHLDRELIREKFERYANAQELEHIDELDGTLRFLADPDEDPDSIDEFARSGVENPEEIRDIFTRQFHFGCEADDPMNSLAFHTRLNPHGARLSAIFGSDVGHWDVPDTREVLAEAWELVEKKLITEDDFRAFVYDNPRGLWLNNNAKFFDGTVLEGGP
ncbi:MAG: amidohydrolase family protein [Deltaproteobacteria bacterium]|nr:amidohydrolase family protein [Deltaproteobacteria bacterium]